MTPANDKDAKTFFYEWDAVVRTSGILDHTQRPDGTDAVQRVRYNALVESFAIHSRALVHFLFSHDGKTFGKNNTPRSTDVVAPRFLSAGVWEQTCPLISAELTRAKENADKQIAHVTESRREIYDTNTGAKTWYHSTIVEEFAELLELFLKCGLTMPYEVQAGIQALIVMARQPAARASTASVTAPHVTGVAAHPVQQRTASMSAATVPPPPQRVSSGITATGCNE